MKKTANSKVTLNNQDINMANKRPNEELPLWSDFAKEMLAALVPPSNCGHEEYILKKCLKTALEYMLTFKDRRSTYETFRRELTNQINILMQKYTKEVHSLATSTVKVSQVHKLDEKSSSTQITSDNDTQNPRNPKRPCVWSQQEGPTSSKPSDAELAQRVQAKEDQVAQDAELARQLQAKLAQEARDAELALQKHKAQLAEMLKLQLAREVNPVNYEQPVHLPQQVQREVHPVKQEEQPVNQKQSVQQKPSVHLPQQVKREVHQVKQEEQPVNQKQSVQQKPSVHLPQQVKREVHQVKQKQPRGDGSAQAPLEL